MTKYEVELQRPLGYISPYHSRSMSNKNAIHNGLCIPKKLRDAIERKNFQNGQS